MRESDEEFIEIESEDEGEERERERGRGEEEEEGMSTIQSFIFHRTKELNEHTQKHPHDIDG